MLRGGPEALAPAFIQIAFGNELGPEAARLNRWEGPIRYAIEGPASPAQRGILDRRMADLARLTGLDIAAGTPADFVILTGERPDAAALRAGFPSVGTSTLAALSRARCFFLFRAEAAGPIRRAVVFVPATLPEPAFLHCSAEETAQALGLPADAGPRGSIFNDDSTAEALPEIDRLLLRTLYAPELRAGMPRDDAMAAAHRALARLLKE